MKCFKKVKISAGSDATDLYIIYLDAVITATAEVLKRKLLGNYRDGIERSVVANCVSFVNGDKAIV